MSYGGRGTVGAVELAPSEAAQWVRDRWADFLAVEPDILDLMHRAAVARGMAREQGNTVLYELGGEVIRDLGALNKLHGSIVDKVEGVASWIGLGAIQVPLALLTVYSVVAAGMIYLFARLEIQRRLVVGLEEGTLTRADVETLAEAGNAPSELLGQAVDLGKLVLWGVLGWFAIMALQEVRAFRENPTLQVFETNPPPELIGERVYAVWYRHEEDGEDYVHHFRPGVSMVGNPDGSVSFRHGRRALWRDFD